MRWYVWSHKERVVIVYTAVDAKTSSHFYVKARLQWRSYSQLYVQWRIRSPGSQSTEPSII